MFDTLPILFKELALQDLPQSIQTQIAKVDACLPQTQCGLCNHPEGCLPYAHAIVTENEPHNKCVPGGQPVSDAIAKVMNRERLPAVASKWATDPNTKRPIEVRAIIREEDCIGCTKCIPACPVDAIVGTGKHMHTVFTDLCTGCELCLPPCPVDCIDLVPIEHHPTPLQREQQQLDLQNRYHHHLNRVADHIAKGHNDKPAVSVMEAKLGNVIHAQAQISETDAKQTIHAAKLRTKIKKLEKQLAIRDNAKKSAELKELKQQLSQL